MDWDDSEKEDYDAIESSEGEFIAERDGEGSSDSESDDDGPRPPPPQVNRPNLPNPLNPPNPDAVFKRDVPLDQKTFHFDATVSDIKVRIDPAAKVMDYLMGLVKKPTLPYPTGQHTQHFLPQCSIKQCCEMCFTAI